MSNPYEVFGLPPDSDDEAIRRRYLELVRQFSPERHPEKFAAVRRAYESLRDLNTRLPWLELELDGPVPAAGSGSRREGPRIDSGDPRADLAPGRTAGCCFPAALRQVVR